MTRKTSIILLTFVLILSSCGGVTPVAPIASSTPTSMRPPTLINTIYSTVTPISTKAAIASTPRLATPPLDHDSVPTQQPNSECLSPLINFAFPVGTINNMGNVSPHSKTLPPNNWQVQINLPDEFWAWGENFTILSNRDIWISGLLAGSNNMAYFIYKPSTEESEVYLKDSIEIPYEYYIPESLLQAEDGTLWGIGTQYGNSYEPWEYQNTKPLISRYNGATGLFEYIEDQNNILHDANASSGIVEAKLDREGKIWILLNQYKNPTRTDKANEISPPGLYRFDPLTRKSDYYLMQTAGFYFRDFLILSDGSIWLSNSNDKKAPLWRFFPTTGELTPYSGSFSYFPGDDISYEGVSEYSHLYLDRDNRLWVDDKGWLINPESERPSWYRVIRSPVFIHGFVDGIGNFYWSEPRGMYESSDGMFWFWADAGTVQLDPASGEWCLFTTYPSAIVEDYERNLWMIADNKLYKYELNR